MAAAVPTTASQLYGDATLWPNPTFDYAAVLATYGAAATGLTSASIAAGYVNLAQTSPIAFAFQLHDETSQVYVGYNPTFYPAVPGSVTPYDTSLILLVGNDLETATPVALPTAAFGRVAGVNAFTTAYMTGANGHTHATAAVVRFPHQAAATGDTEVRNVRGLVPIPPALTPQLLQTAPEGIFSLTGFWNILMAEAGSGDAARVAAVEAMTHWWQVACMGSAAGVDVSPVEVTPVSSASPTQLRHLGRWAVRQRNLLLARLGVGGPQLSNAGFTQGILNLQNTITQANNAQLAANLKTFSDRYGVHIAQTMYNLCNVATDAALPSIHRTLAKSDKGQMHSILLNAIQARALASSVPLTDGNLPLLTTSLSNEVFRNFAVADFGASFGKGLTPFAMVCQGHAEANVVAKSLKKADIIEGGTSVTSQDAERMTVTDVRMPTQPQIAAEKLYAFSVVVDLFHGETHPIANSVRAAVTAIAPALHAVCAHAGAHKVGMDYCNRVLYEIQQDYFLWARTVAREPDPARRPVVPDFQKIANAVITFRVGSLSVLPQSWYALIETDAARSRDNQDRSSKKPSPARDMQSVVGATRVTNVHADESVVARFKASGHSNISDMMTGHTCTIPKHNQKDVCMAWGLKGECSDQCKRKAQHVRYSQAINNGFHRLMDDCKVDDLQQ